MPSATLETLSRCLMLGTLLSEVRRRWGAYELLDHWQQGEFHHDVVLRVAGAAARRGLGVPMFVLGGFSNLPVDALTLGGSPRG